MSVHNILVNGNPLLRKVSKPVKSVTGEIRQLIENMIDTMYANHGAGLAAIQIGNLKRIIVVDVSKEKDDLIVLINPKIVKKIDEQIGTEACLSVPGLEGKVCRSLTIKVKAKNSQFQDIDLEAEGYFAVAIQHEIDHLDGVLYIDRVEKESLRPTSNEDSE